MRYGKAQKFWHPKKALCYFYYHEMGLDLKQTGEAVGIDFTTVHHHKEDHPELFTNNFEYRDLYLEARYQYYTRSVQNLDDVPAD